MTQFFEKRDRWGNGLALWVLVAMIFIIPPAALSLRQIKLKNDVTGWLPEDDPEAKVLAWYRDLFPEEDRIVVSWKGSSLTDPRVDQFAQKLQGFVDDQGVRRNGSKYVKEVITPRDALDRMVDQDIEPEEALRRLGGVLLGTGPVRVELSQAGQQHKAATIGMLRQQALAELGLEIEIAGPPAQAATAFRPAELGFADTAEAGGFIDDAEGFDVAEGFIEEENAGGFIDDAQLGFEDADGGFVEDSADHAHAETPAWQIARSYDLEVSWPGMHMRPGEIEAFQKLARKLNDSDLGGSGRPRKLVADCFLLPGSPVALSVVMSEAGVADEAAALAEIRKTATEVGVPKEDFSMGGKLVAGTALNQAVRKVGRNREFPIYQLHKRSPLLLSCLLSIVLAFFMLRSLRLATLVLVATFYTTLLTVALVPVTGGSMNMVLVVMPTLLMVLTVSAGIHVANYWKHAAHRDMRTAVVEATKMARQPCILASVTTAIGLMSLTTSTLTPVSDFGFYAALGCLVSLVMVLYGLPTLLAYWPSSPPKASEVDRGGWRRLGGLLFDYRKLVTGVFVLAFIFGLLGLRWFRTETKVIRYFPDHSPIVQDYRFLENNLAGIIPVDIVVRFDAQAQENLNFFERMEVVRHVQERIRRHPEISGTISLADFQPKYQPPPKDASFLDVAAFNKRMNSMEDRIKQGKEEAASAFLAAPAEASALHDAGDELWRITAQASLMSDANYADLIADLDKISSSVLIPHVGTRHVVTGMVPLFLRTQVAVLQSLIRSFGLAFVIIAAVMMVLLRSPTAGLITMLPNLLPVAFVFGLISWLGLAIDVGTMITASVALGIAVDGTLHLLTWFRSGVQDGLTRREAVSQALGHCGPAMWQTSTAVGLGLLMLYPTELLLVSRFAWLMAALIGAALAADIVLLPALLGGALGRLIENTVRRSQRSAAVAPPQTSVPKVGPSRPHVRLSPGAANARVDAIDAPA